MPALRFPSNPDDAERFIYRELFPAIDSSYRSEDAKAYRVAREHVSAVVKHIYDADPFRRRPELTRGLREYDFTSRGRDKLWSPSTKAKAEALLAAGRQKNAKKDVVKWAVVQQRGLDDLVISTHRTKEAAEKAMEKRGGGPGGRMDLRVVDVGSSGPWEIVDLPWGQMIRPRQKNTRHANLARKLK